MFNLLRKIKIKKLILISALIIFGLGLLSGGIFLIRKPIGHWAIKLQNFEIKQPPLMAVLAESTDSVDIIQLAEEPKKEEPKQTTTEAKPKPAPEPSVPAPSYGGSFQWGATMRPSAIGYSAENWQAQIDKAKELGLGWARINYDYGGGLARNDVYINALLDAGLKINLVVEHNPGLGVGNMYGDGLDDGKTIAGHYKGRVSFYQLANEGGAQSIKSGTLEGWRTSDYDQAEYERIRDYIRGLSEGIAAVDSGATRIVTISWMHTGFLDKLVADGVDFDMIGVDWYSWMGNFGGRTIGSGQTLYGKIKSFRKPIIFAEVNAWPQNDSINEESQASFVKNTAAWAWNNRAFVKGFYVYELVDNAVAPGIYQYFGIVSAKVGEIGAPRAAFNALKELIN